jgi:hypothetical protein
MGIPFPTLCVASLCQDLHPGGVPGICSAIPPGWNHKCCPLTGGIARPARSQPPANGFHPSGMNRRVAALWAFSICFGSPTQGDAPKRSLALGYRVLAHSGRTIKNSLETECWVINLGTSGPQETIATAAQTSIPATGSTNLGLHRFSAGYISKSHRVRCG